MLMRLEINYKGFFGAKESACQCKRNGFDPWSRKVPHTIEQLSSLDLKETKAVNSKWNQSWLFIGRTDAEAEVPMIGHLMQRTDSLEKTLMLRKIESGKRREWQRMRLLDGITYSMDMSQVDSGLWWWTGRLGVLQSMTSQSQTRLSNWTEVN